MSATEVLRRLEDHVERESGVGRLFGEPAGRGYVGAFHGRTFRIRIARPMSQFYATYLFGRIEGSGEDSVISFHFGHRQAAAWALWIIRFVAIVLVSGALVAALQQPVFLFGAVFVALGIALLLWAYRLRADDTEKLRSFLVGLTR